MEMPASGLFALVSYVPGPLGPFLDGIRMSLPGTDFPKAHITILPPRALGVPLDEATRHATAVLQSFTAFEVELASVGRFAETDVVYLTISRGNAKLLQLHEALNEGCLGAAERFDFLPHITIGGPIPNAESQAAERRAEDAWFESKLPKSFLFREIVALWAQPTPEGYAEWEQVWCFRLPMVATAASSNQKL